MSLIEGKESNFNEIVLKNEKPVLVDFNASWCGPCRMLKPIIDDLAENNEKIDFVSIDVDEAESLASEYGVMSIPCLVLFKDGKEVNRSVGFMPKEELEKFIGE